MSTEIVHELAGLRADVERLLNERGRWMDCAADLTIRLEESEQERAALAAKLSESHGLILDVVRRLHSTGDPGDQLVADLAQRAETAEQEHAALRERVAELTAALREQWEAAHDDRCGSLAEICERNPIGCVWKMPAPLRAAQAPAAEGARVEG